MKRIKNSELRMKNFVFVIFLFCILHSAFYIPTAQAADATASASLLQKLNALKAEVASKAASLKSDVNKKLSNRFAFGQIFNLDDNKLTIITSKGNLTISVNEYTIYQNNTLKKRAHKNITLKDLSKDDFIYALGDIDDKGVLAAKKIIKGDSLKKNSRQIFWGRVQSAIPSAIVVKTKDGQLVNTQFSTKTTLGNVSAGNIVAIVGEDSGELFETRFVYIISGGSLKPKEKTATKSATP